MQTSKSEYNSTTSDPVRKLQVPFPIGYIYGTEPGRGRNGLGIQTWPDGSRYEGEFENDLKHGVGVYCWPSGEIYEGYFCKDYRHGKGTYTWPDGSKFTGKFYLNRKEGYGVQLFADGSCFKGLYHADERFGPGVLTYADGRQDVGLWHRNRLLHLCTRLEDGFSLRSLPEFQQSLEGVSLQEEPQNLHAEPRKPPHVNKDPLVLSTEEMLRDERFILPPDTLRYATDPDHLPLPPRLRRQLDELFFENSSPKSPEYTHTQAHTHRNANSLPLQERMQDHIYRHRFEAERVDWDVHAVLSLSRDGFGPKGSLELSSERIILEATRGDAQAVYRILRDGRIHPDVGDAQGHTPLIAATVNCHNQVINMLLDCGANANKLNGEGMSALAVCLVLHYSPHSLHTTVTEVRRTSDSPKPQVTKFFSRQAEAQRNKDGEDSTCPVPQKTESADESLLANEETAQSHKQADPDQTQPANSPIMERGLQSEASEEEELSNRSRDPQTEYSENECLGHEKWEESKQKTFHVVEPQREEPTNKCSEREEHQIVWSEKEGQGFINEASESEGLLNEASKSEGLLNEASESEGLLNEGSEREGLINEGSERERLLNEGSEREGLITEVSKSEGLLNEASESEGLLNEGSEREGLINEGSEREGLLNEGSEREGLLNEGSEREGLITEVSERDGLLNESSEKQGLLNGLEQEEPLFEDFTMIGPREDTEPEEDNEEGATVKHMTCDPENPGQHSAFDSTLSMVSMRMGVAEEALEQAAEALCQSGRLPPEGTQEPVHKIALAKNQQRQRWSTLRLLLVRGADPNASQIPMPVLFLAIKAAHTQAVQLLLESGARTDICLPSKLNGLYPLHVAAGLPGDEGPRITELLLHAVADPDVRAQDAHVVFELDQNMLDPQGGSGNKSGVATQGPGSGSLDRGRTPLHVACQRDHDYQNARDVVRVLLSHKASTSVLWSGHSPLSLAIASGNELAVDVLLASGADPNLPLSSRVGSALCANANIAYNNGPNRILLLEKLMKAGANILMPILIGEGRRCAVGTALDYAYYSFNQDWRIAHTPYHALNPRERETLNARRRLLSIMGELLRKAANRSKQSGLEDDLCSSENVTYTGAKTVEENASTESIRKQAFKYCYQCGRSVGVVLVACSRCREVSYCSKTCKMKAWNERHKEECVRVQGHDHSETNEMQERKPQRESRADSKKASQKTPEQPSLLTQMKAHLRHKRILEKLTKRRKVLAQTWAEKHHASGDQLKDRGAGAKDRPTLSQHPPQTQLCDSKENYSYV